MWLDRTKMLIGQENLDKLEKSHIAIVGLGGVGGYVAVMLARCGVGFLTLIDFDRVDETNINRQVVANTKTVGRLKVDVLSEILTQINPKIQLKVLSERLTENNVEKLIEKDLDYCIDCIDSVKDKVELCAFCHFNHIPIISAMGAGNRFDVPQFKVMDVYKTTNDGLAKIMRKRLREKGVKNLKVVAPLSLPVKSEMVGSISYYPAMCGCVLSAQVCNEIIKNENL